MSIKEIENKNFSIGDLLDVIYPTKATKDNKLIFKDERTGEIYNLAYHYVVSEIMYLYVYKDTAQKTVGYLNYLIEYESHDSCWNEKAIRYIEELAKENYAEDDYMFSDEKIEKGDLGDERFEVVKSLDVFIIFDDKEDIGKLDELLKDDSKIVSFNKVRIEDDKVTVMFESKSSEDEDILEVDYVSVWDNGVGIETKAKYNKKTGLVFDIGVTDEDIEDLTTLDSEYIRLPNGDELSVNNDKGDYMVTDFVELLQKNCEEESEIAKDEDYPLIDEALIEFANDNDIILNHSDIVTVTKKLDIDSDGYPYVEEFIYIAKYNVELRVRAYHHKKWDFYITYVSVFNGK